jgi:hypothetical protein
MRGPQLVEWFGGVDFLTFVICIVVWRVMAYVCGEEEVIVQVAARWRVSLCVGFQPAS